MLQWCVDNLVIMQVSLSEQVLSYFLILYYQHTVANAWRNYGGIMNVTNIHIDEVFCTGDETKLIDCYHDLESYNCSQDCNATAVICTGKLSDTVNTAL